mgnify:CR=1 FL=1
MFVLLVLAVLGGIAGSLLLVIAVFDAIAGSFSLGDATMGVGVIGLSCLAGILARIVQAQRQHNEMISALGYNSSPKP